ncbi:MAG: VWA domain-containing protein [Acidobacteriota bacterium]|nr:VWA domain-containing protein [Acidobacteriota bacterium]
MKKRDTALNRGFTSIRVQPLHGADGACAPRVCYMQRTRIFRSHEGCGILLMLRKGWGKGPKLSCMMRPVFPYPVPDSEVDMTYKFLHAIGSRLHARALCLGAVALVAAAPVLPAQSTTPAQPAQQQDQTPPEAGGPSGDNGVIALPKKKEGTVAPPPAAARPVFKNPEGAGNYSIRVDVPEVTLDVGVLLQKTGQFVPGLKPDNFRVYENGVEQKVIGFKRVEAPITALLLCEFASTNYYFVYDMRNAAWAFAQQLRPQDYVALMTYDMRTQIQLDFTQDKRQLLNAINSLVIPGFTERNMFDALSEALDRLSRIPGRKYIILIGSGRDTFSKITLDDILKKIKNTQDITIFTVSTGGALRAVTEGQPGWGAEMRDMDYLQADNEMRTFAKMTGGMSFFPRFEGEMPDIFGAINQAIRSKYELVYHPSDAKQDGTYRKLRVELVDDEGKPLRIQDQKHKNLKYEIIARDGYKAKEEVE